MTENQEDTSNFSLALKGDEKRFLTMEIGDQLIGIRVDVVRDVLVAQKILPIPLAPRKVIGSLNLRGRIVTAVDIREILGISAEMDFKKAMNVVVEFDSELYSLIVNSIGEVMNISLSNFVDNPGNLAKEWINVSEGVLLLKNRLLVIIDTSKLLTSFKSKDEAEEE